LWGPFGPTPLRVHVFLVAVY